MKKNTRPYPKRSKQTLISNQIREQTVEYRIIHTPGYKTAILATNENKTKRVETTIPTITNRTPTELEDLFIHYNPNNKTTAYHNRTYEGQPDIIIYNNLISKLKTLQQQYNNNNNTYDLLKRLLQSLNQVTTDPLGPTDQLNDGEWIHIQQLQTEAQNEYSTAENKLLEENRRLKKKIDELETLLQKSRKQSKIGGEK